MAALTAARNTPEKAHAISMADERPVAGSTTIYQGGIVVVSAAGYLAPATTATGLICAGRADETVANTGAAGALTCKFSQGVFRFGNSAAGDAITVAEIGDDCYLVDDQTVAKTDDTGARSRAGKIYDVDANGVWVLMGLGV